MTKFEIKADKQLVNSKEFARIIGVSSGTLAVWRTTKHPDIPYIKIGGKVLYNIDEVNNWIQNQNQKQISQR